MRERQILRVTGKPEAHKKNNAFSEERKNGRTSDLWDFFNTFRYFYKEYWDQRHKEETEREAFSRLWQGKDFMGKGSVNSAFWQNGLRTFSNRQIYIASSNIKSQQAPFLLSVFNPILTEVYLTFLSFIYLVLMRNNWTFDTC